MVLPTLVAAVTRIARGREPVRPAATERPVPSLKRAMTVLPMRVVRAMPTARLLVPGQLVVTVKPAPNSKLVMMVMPMPVGPATWIAAVQERAPLAAMG